jgi:hypothetical protein
MSSRLNGYTCTQHFTELHSLLPSSGATLHPDPVDAASCRVSSVFRTWSMRKVRPCPQHCLLSPLSDRAVRTLGRLNSVTRTELVICRPDQSPTTLFALSLQEERQRQLLARCEYVQHKRGTRRQQASVPTVQPLPHLILQNSESNCDTPWQACSARFVERLAGAIRALTLWHHREARLCHVRMMPPVVPTDCLFQTLPTLHSATSTQKEFYTKLSLMRSFVRRSSLGQGVQVSQRTFACGTTAAPL